jgi:competence protein ComGC
MYSVVTGMYAGQMLGSVESTSMGLLTITPRDEKGNPIAPDQLVNYVVKDEEGKPVKEWYAIASYLKEMGGEMDEKYSETDGRKTVYSSLNPVDLFRNANKFTYIMIVIVIVLIILIILIVRAIVRKIKKAKLKKAKALEESQAAAAKAALANAIEEEYNTASVEDNGDQISSDDREKETEEKNNDDSSDGFDY